MEEVGGHRDKSDYVAKEIDGRGNRPDRAADGKVKGGDEKADLMGEGANEASG